jgi:hypothetical protein
MGNRFAAVNSTVQKACKNWGFLFYFDSDSDLQVLVPYELFC